jgi:hypothetical protein
MQKYDNILNRVVEIEDYNGNTIMAFMVDEKGNIIKYDNCDIANVEIDDYLFDSEKEIIRIQCEKEV